MDKTQNEHAEVQHIKVEDLPAVAGGMLNDQEMGKIQGGTIGFSMCKPVYEWIEAS